MKRLILCLAVVLATCSAFGKARKKTIVKQPQLSTIEIIEKVNDY